MGSEGKEVAAASRSVTVTQTATQPEKGFRERSRKLRVPAKSILRFSQMIVRRLMKYSKCHILPKSRWTISPTYLFHRKKLLVFWT